MIKIAKDGQILVLYDSYGSHSTASSGVFMADLIKEIDSLKREIDSLKQIIKGLQKNSHPAGSRDVRYK